MPDRVRESLKGFLLGSRNPDGGWGYYPGKSSRLEPTCWALLALGERATDASVLARWPVEGGLLLERPAGAPNFAFHGLGLLALHALRIEHAAGTPALVRGIQAVKGRALRPSDINRQDNSLAAWSWIPETFSWVEPTAWCLLALKKWRGAPGVKIDDRRVDTAERLLIDRACLVGGWNYGNSNMLGQELKPYVATTALGVLAMQDQQAVPEIARSIDYLQANASKELSGLSLSLSMLALQAVGKSSGPVRDLLVRQGDASLELKNQLAVATSLYALRADDHHAFQL
ncbi:MAG: hypothetical protein H0X67_12840 [Acidobacteria bacterium]|nr:hypothetical protein [Acidobacteriota bacterium]